MKVFVKPNPLWPLLRDPISLQYLAAGGEWKPRNSYWLRRIRFADVLEAEPPKVKSQPQNQKPQAEKSQKKKGE